MLIGVFAVRMKTRWVLGFPQSAMRRLRSNCADARFDLSFRCVHIHSCRKCWTSAHLCLVAFYVCMKPINEQLDDCLIAWLIGSNSYARHVHTHLHYDWCTHVDTLTLNCTVSFSFLGNMGKEINKQSPFNWIFANVRHQLCMNGCRIWKSFVIDKQFCWLANNLSHVAQKLDWKRMWTKKWLRSTCTFKDMWARAWQTQQMPCATSEDSDQAGHPPSLIRVFAVRSMGS